MLLQTDQNVSPELFRQLSDMVYQHCGINLHDGKQELVRARVAKRLRETGHGSADQYLESVMAHPDSEEFAQLIDSLSTNLTSFFRESSHFDFLRDRFLPTLLDARQAKGGKRLRAWSAGCSTGEEPYTLAITILDALAGRGEWDAKILATDISRRVLRRAAAGVYDKERLEAVSPQHRAKYFTSQRDAGRTQFSVGPELRAMVRFNYLNLMDEWPFSGPFDVIFCRNVMIYFDKPTQEKLVNRFYQCLGSGGLLLTGHSESLTGVAHKLRYVQPTIYAKP